ncbi:MAG: alpha/beta hydrolase [Saprospiraceae bacterium]|jgi:pimeloyl-ACP methyl ester carboxylesterase|nr:alpha/beta hydrolase [Saprospiraceae bacterium]
MKNPLLLLHGALGCAAQFDDLKQDLSADRILLALDFPGHGGASTDTEFSIDRFAESVLAFLDKNSLSQVDIFGYSMGGYVAYWLARQHPERVGRIITLGTKLAWSPETAARETAMLNPEKIAAKVPAFAQMLADRHAPADWQAVVRKTVDLLHDLGNGAALEPDDFRAIACPVVVGLGEADNMVTREESEQVVEWLPNGRFEVLPGVKHPFEQVDQKMLAGWLQECLG